MIYVVAPTTTLTSTSSTMCVCVHMHDVAQIYIYIMCICMLTNILRVCDTNKNLNSKIGPTLLRILLCI